MSWYVAAPNAIYVGASSAGGVTATPGLGVLSVTAHAASIAVTAGAVIGLATVAVTGWSPTAAALAGISPSPANVHVSAAAPAASVSANIGASIDAATVHLTGLTPSVAAINPAVASTGVAVIDVASMPPSVLIAPAGELWSVQPGAASTWVTLPAPGSTWILA